MQKLTTTKGHEIAIHKTPAKNKGLPDVLFLGGFMSDMEGSKALFLEKSCTHRGQGFVRFDYSGHGKSSGAFTDGTITSWLNDAIDVFDSMTDSPKILVGSSMGGWIMLLLALKRQTQIAGLVGIAPAPDFTKDMYETGLTDAQKHQLHDEGIVYIPSDYTEPYPITEPLIEDGKNNFLLDSDKLLSIKCPVRILHGKKDISVPWEKSVKIKGKLGSNDVALHFIDDGDHSLSCKAGLTLLDGAVQTINRIVAPDASDIIMKEKL